MKRYSVLPIILVLFFFFSNDLLAQHALQIDNGLGNYSVINAPNPGGLYTLPPGGGTLLTTVSLGSSVWVTGGNLGSSPNNQLGTLDGTDLQFITGGLANIRMAISGATGFIGIGTSTPGHLLEINGTVDASETDPFASTNWDLAVTGDIAATGIIKSGAGVTINGVSNPHEVVADQPLKVYTNNGDLTLSTGIPLGNDINLNPENIVNLQAISPASETKLHMIMNPNFGGVSWDYGISNSGQLAYSESGFDNYGFYLNTDNNPAGGGSFTVNFGADHNGAPLQGFLVNGSGNGTFAGSLTIGNIPALSSSLNILTTNAGQVEQRTAASILGSTAWILTGNTLSGGTPQTPNEWMGSANDYDLVFKSNNNEVMRVTDNGHLTNALLSNPLDAFGQGVASNGLLWEVSGDGYAATISNTDNNPHRNGLLVSIAENTGAARLLDAQSGGGTKFLVSSDGATSIYGPAILASPNSPLNAGGSDGTLGNVLQSNGAGLTPSWVDGSGLFIQNQFAGAQTANFWVTGNGTINGGAIVGSGLNITGGTLLMGGASVLDQARNLFNIGNISLAGSIGTATTINASGIITTTGGLNLNGAAAPLELGGNPGALGQILTSAAGATPTWTTLSTVAVTSVVGTANQVLANGTSGSSQTGVVTLTTPQDIALTSNVTFNSATLSSLNASQPVRTDPAKKLVSGAINLAGGATEVSGTLPFGNGGTGQTAYTANTTLIINPGNTAIISLANGGTNTVLHGTTPPSYSAIGTADLSAGANNTFLTTDGTATVAWTGLNVGTGLSGNGITTAIDANIQHDATLSGLGTTGSNLALNLAHANTWTAQQTFNLANGFKYVDGNQAASKVLLSDASGQGSWSFIGTSSLSGGANNNMLVWTGGTAAWQNIVLGAGLTGNGVGTALDANIQHNATLTGTGGSASNLGIDLTHANNWTGQQTITLANGFKYVDGNQAVGDVLVSDAAGQASWTPLSGIATIAIVGTANQVLANGTSGSSQTGIVTLTTPQDIAATSDVTFNSATLSALTAGQPVRTNGSSKLISGAIDLAGGITEVINTLPFGNGGTGAASYTANTSVIIDPTNTSMISLANGGANTVLHGTTPPSYSAIGTADLSAGANNTFLTTDGTGTVAWTGLSIGAGLSGDGITTALTNSGVLSVSGTANRVSSSGGQNPVIDIDANYAGQSSIITLGTITTGTWNGTIVDIAHGGTGQTTGNGAFNALSPMAAFGDIIYEDATPAAAALAGNTTTTKMFLSQTGTGVTSGVPAWTALSATDVSTGGWALGGNTAPSSNLLGTLDATDLEIVTGTGGPNPRLFISGTTGNIGIGTTTTTAAAVSFGTFTGNPAIDYYDGGATARYGIGVLQADAEIQNFIPSGSHFSWNLGGEMQSTGSNELMRLSAVDGTLSNTFASGNNALDDAGTGIGSTGLLWQGEGGGIGYAASFSNIDGTTAAANGLLVKIANTTNTGLIFTASSGAINSSGTDRFKIFGDGTVQISTLNANMPVQTDGSKNLKSAAIDVSTSAVTGVLPVIDGGTNSSTALTNGAIMVSSGGAIVEGTSSTTPSFTSISVHEAKGAAAGHYAEQHTVAAGEIAGATVTIANAIVAGATSVVVANIVSSANGATSLLTSANAGNVILTFNGGNPAAGDVVNYVVVNP